MNIDSLNLKIIIGVIYLAIISIGLYLLFSVIDFKDLMSYEFIRLNKDVILKYKADNFIILAVIFFIFCIIWVLLLGFAMPLLLFSGFVFGKWWGILIVLSATTLGAALLYILAGFFFKEAIRKKLAPKFSKFKEFFNRNDIIYFMCFRFVGGGGIPYAVQNVLPVLFDMPIKNYIVATFIGSMPSMFVSVSLGSGIEKVIDKNIELSFSNVVYAPEIYVPIIAFFIILIFGFVIKKFLFRQ